MNFAFDWFWKFYKNDVNIIFSFANTCIGLNYDLIFYITSNREKFWINKIRLSDNIKLWYKQLGIFNKY